jgi:SAM-dependent methyltransferase
VSSPPISRTVSQLEEISARTLADYDARAEAFWQGTRDHDVSQNRAAFLRAIDGAGPFRILDFGCGPGRDLSYFRSLGHHAVGLDGASSFVEMARRFSGCEVLRQDFLKLSLGGREFDGIFANASLFHVPTGEVARVLRELRAALAPRGVLFSSNPRGTDTEGFSGERFGAFHTIEAWRRIVTQAGFDEIEHYYRPPGRPRAEQPWLASVWRKASSLRIAFEAGAREFDDGAFWEAHEVWEECWRESKDATARLALQGLIQIAAALHKLVVTGSPDSASRLFAKGLAKLDAVPSDFEIDLGSFRDAIRACARALAGGHFEAGSIPKLCGRSSERPSRGSSA